MGLANKPTYIRPKEEVEGIKEAKKPKPKQNLFNRVLPVQVKAWTKEELEQKLEARLASGWEQVGEIKYEPPQPVTQSGQRVGGKRNIVTDSPRNRGALTDEYYYVYVKKPTKPIKQ